MEKNMYKMIQLLMIPLMIFLTPAISGSEQDTGKDEISEAIGYYFRAHATGNGEYLRYAFHPVAKLFFVRDNALAQFTLEEYIALFDGNPPVDEDQRIRTIDQIDISGNAAVATITLDYPNAVYTDYMSMLNIDGQWKIVNKTFYLEPR